MIRVWKLSPRLFHSVVALRENIGACPRLRMAVEGACLFGGGE